MIWLFVVVSAVASFMIAAVAVGSVTARQSMMTRPVVYDLDRAVEFVADHLDAEVTATLGYDEVRSILLWHLEYLQRKGVASYGADAEAETALVVVSDDEPLAYVIGRAEADEVDIADEHVAAVLQAQEDYYRSIGAVGPQVSEPSDPDPDPA